MAMTLEDFRATRQTYTPDEVKAGAEDDYRLNKLTCDMASGGITGNVATEEISKLHLYETGVTNAGYEGWVCVIERIDGRFWWYDYGEDADSLASAESKLWREFVEGF